MEILSPSPRAKVTSKEISSLLGRSMAVSYCSALSCQLLGLLTFCLFLDFELRYCMESEKLAKGSFASFAVDISFCPYSLDRTNEPEIE